MNKRKLNKIIGLHKDGISFELCLAMIIDLSANHNQAATFIAEFIQIRTPQIYRVLTSSPQYLSDTSFDDEISNFNS